MPKNKLAALDPVDLSSNPRATLQAWLNYQSVILQAVSRHPLPFTFAPQNKSPQTVVSRLRDAVRGCLAFGYDISDTAVTQESLLRWYAEVVFKFDKDLVIIGPPERLRDRLHINEQTHDSRYHYPFLTFEEIAAFQLLLSTGKISGPVIIDTAPDMTLLPSRDNVEMTLNDKKQLVLF